jgi:hypothetical protein
MVVVPRLPQWGKGGFAALDAIAKSFFRYGKPYNPPYPPLKGVNYRELLLKSPFGKGGFRGI